MPPNQPAPPLAHQHLISGAQLLEDDERLITVVRKSILVLIGLYLEILAGVAALAALVILLKPSLFADLTSTGSGLLILTLVIALTVFIVVLVTMIYRQNHLLIGDKSLIEVTQRGPFSNKAARLSMSNVEDVSAAQAGFLATAFNYGTLLVQTAGTRENFEFTYCPDPNRYAHQILEARDAYAEALRESGEHPQNT